MPETYWFHLLKADAIDKISCGGKYNMSLVDELRKLKDGGENDD